MSELFHPVTIRAVYADDDTAIVIWDAAGSSAMVSPTQVAQNLFWIVAIRDSKDPGGPKLFISPAVWRAFIHGVEKRESLPVDVMAVSASSRSVWVVALQSVDSSRMSSSLH